MHVTAALVFLICLTTPSLVQTTSDELLQKFFQVLIDTFTTTTNEDDVLPQPRLFTETYDFIIVGSGSAGSALANRLSENPDWNILLLEAGKQATFLTEIPAIMPLFQFTDLNWAYKAEKQDNVCLGCPDQKMRWPRGKALGGTSVINYMLYVRGNSGDYDRWEAMGNPGWSYEDVLPYFKKMESADIDIADEGYHNTSGYLSVTDVPYRTESASAFVQASQEAGHPYVDYNGAKQMGTSYVQASLKRGKRWDARKAYINTAKDRSNLKILTNARVLKVLINNDTKTAYGVQYQKGLFTYEVLASKEVILSAGALSSPQLLMLSGIGPKDHLEELGIPVVQDLPVGQKLYDHLVFFGLLFQLSEPIIYKISDLLNPLNYLSLYLSGTGPLTSIGWIEAFTYLKTNASNETDDYPDIELIFAGACLGTDHGIAAKTFSINDTTYDGFFRPLEGKPYYQVFPMLVHPRSYGHIKLQSTSVYDHPLFYPNYFTDEENHDIKTFIASIREVQKINASPAWQKYNATIYSTPIPGCEAETFDSNEYWECALRHVAVTVHHQVSTCKMGPSNDTEAVVDHKLRVHGLNNLRVVDTSVIPLPLTAHTNIPGFLVGEKASDIIKEDWQDS